MFQGSRNSGSLFLLLDGSQGMSISITLDRRPELVLLARQAITQTIGIFCHHRVTVDSTVWMFYAGVDMVCLFRFLRTLRT